MILNAGAFLSHDLSPDHVVIFRMRSDPEPQDSICRLHTDCSMVQADPGGPEPADLLEMERRMSRVCLQ